MLTSWIKGTIKTFFTFSVFVTLKHISFLLPLIRAKSQNERVLSEWWIYCYRNDPECSNFFLLGQFFCQVLSAGGHLRVHLRAGGSQCGQIRRHHSSDEIQQELWVETRHSHGHSTPRTLALLSSQLPQTCSDKTFLLFQTIEQNGWCYLPG